MIFKRISFVAVSFLSAVAYAADKPKTINVCAQEFREEMVTAALFLGDKKSMFEKEQLKLKWNMGHNLNKKETAALMKAGNINAETNKLYLYSVQSEAQVMRNAEKNNCDVISTTFEAAVGSGVDLSKYVPVAVYRYGKDYDTPVVVRANSPIKTLKDIKGKRVRLNQVGSLIPFEDMMKTVGLTSADVTYEKVAFADLPAALDKGEVDVVFSYNPTLPLLLGSGRVRVLEPDLFSRYYPHHVPHSLLLVKKEFAATESYTPFMKAFSAASAELVRKPENLINSVPAINNVYTNVEIEKSLSFVKVGVPIMRTQMTAQEFYKQANFTEYQDILHKKGFLKKSVDLAAWNQ